MSFARLITGHQAQSRLINYIALHGANALRGKMFSIEGKVYTFSNQLGPSHCISYIYHYYRAVSPTTGFLVFNTMDRSINQSLEIIRSEFPLPEDCSGAVNGSSHKPEIGENTMSHNTTKRLFQIANFNLGSTVKKQGVEFLVAGFRGFYQNAQISTYSSDDVTSVPPTDNPTIEYQLLGRDGRTVVARKNDITLVLSNRGIHEKLALGTAVAFGSAKDDLEDLKSEWTRVRRVATGATPSWTSPAPVAVPVAPRSVVVTTEDGITATVTFNGSAEDLYEKLERLVG